MNKVTTDFLLEVYNAGTTTWTDITDYMLAGTLRISQEVNSRAIMTFDLFDPSGALAAPSVGQQIRLSDVKDASRRYCFGGQVHRTGKRRLSNSQPYRYEVQCQDWSCLLDRYRVTASYTGWTLGSIVADIIGTMDPLDQLGVTNVDQGPVLASVNLPTISLQEALDELMRETGYKYWVSYDKELYVKSKTGSAASWELTDATAVSRTVGMPVVERDRSQYRNVQEVRGGNKADDEFTFFPPVGQPGMYAVWSTGSGGTYPPQINLGRPISEVKFVYVGQTPTALTPDDKTDAGLIFTAGPRGADTLFVYDAGGTYLYVNLEYHKAGDSTIWYAHETFPVTGIRYVWCDVKFQAAASGVARKDSEWCAANGVAETDTIAQQAAIEGGSGVYYNLEINEKLQTVQECQEKANALLKEYGTIPTIVSYVSDDWGDLTVGQSQHVEIYGLDKDCLVRSMEITDVSGVWLRAEIELVGSEKQGFAQFWRALSGGSTAGMQNKYAVRPLELPTEYAYLSDEALTVDDSDLTATEVDSAGTWGAGAIGEGAEWA